jgi:hypothetical protein
MDFRCLGRPGFARVLRLFTYTGVVVAEFQEYKRIFDESGVLRRDRTQPESLNPKPLVERQSDCPFTRTPWLK